MRSTVDIQAWRAANPGVRLDLYRANLTGTNLRWAALSGANLRWANLDGANLDGADLTGADLTGADLREADLREADLTGADLREADLRWANLRWANLDGANLDGADLTGADLTGADLPGAELRGATGLPCQDVDHAALRAQVAAHIEQHPELHNQWEWGDGSADPGCGAPCCVAGWLCHFGGGDRGLSVQTAAYLLAGAAQGFPVPSFSADAKAKEILATLRQGRAE